MPGYGNCWLRWLDLEKRGAGAGTQFAAYTHPDGTVERVRVVREHSVAEGGGVTIFLTSTQRERQTARRLDGFVSMTGQELIVTWGCRIRRTTAMQSPSMSQSFGPQRLSEGGQRQKRRRERKRRGSEPSERQRRKWRQKHKRNGRQIRGHGRTRGGGQKHGRTKTKAKNRRLRRQGRRVSLTRKQGRGAFQGRRKPKKSTPAAPREGLKNRCLRRRGRECR